MDSIFFDGWMPLLRTTLLTLFAYVSLVLLLRVSGKRTLSKMNAFDLLVTVALGSALATVILSKDTSLVQGVLAFALLVGCQFAVTWLSVRWGWVRRFVTGEPQMLFYRGEFLRAAMRRSRVTEDEIRAALRGAGLGDTGAAHAVVLETDASFSVVRSTDAAAASSSSSLSDVQGAPAEHR